MQKSRLVVFALLQMFVLVAGMHFSSALARPQTDPNAVFPVETLEIVTSTGKYAFTVEIADTEETRARGLMFREKMLPTHGMLFDFKQNEMVSMWMKNTILSLDMVFIRPDGTVARIESNTQPGSLRVITSGEPVSHVLELNAGISRFISLKPGDRILHGHFSP